MLILQNRESGDRARVSGTTGSGGDFQRADSSPGSRPSSVLPDLLTSSPGQRQDKSTSEEVRHGALIFSSPTAYPMLDSFSIPFLFYLQVPIALVGA